MSIENVGLEVRSCGNADTWPVSTNECGSSASFHCSECIKWICPFLCQAHTNLINTIALLAVQCKTLKILQNIEDKFFLYSSSFSGLAEHY